MNNLAVVPLVGLGVGENCGRCLVIVPHLLDLEEQRGVGEVSNSSF